MDHFKREEDASIRKATFVAYWLSKCVFGEPPAYSIKLLYFRITIKITVGVCFPLAPLLLGQLDTQLDLLHAEELVGLSCHMVATAFNSSVVYTFLWEHALTILQRVESPMRLRTSLQPWQKRLLFVLVIFREMYLSCTAGWVVNYVITV
jgi:hypothetical protein